MDIINNFVLWFGKKGTFSCFMQLLLLRVVFDKWFSEDEHFFSLAKGQNLTSEPPLYLYLYLYVRICICICVFVFVFDHDYLLFWFIFDENPFLRLRLALHEYLGVLAGTGSFLGDGKSETLSEGIPAQLFDSPWGENCQIGPKWTKKSTLLS